MSPKTHKVLIIQFGTPSWQLHVGGIIIRLITLWNVQTVTI